MIKTTNSRSSEAAGFTLIEVLVSVAIFLVVMTISMGAILGVYDAHQKTRAESAVMGNLNLALETMSREMRFGKNYHCGLTGSLTVPANCSSGDNAISFLSNENIQITYKQTGQSIEKSTDGVNFFPVTAPEVGIESIIFYVLGATPEGAPNDQQPRVLIKIKGNSGTRNVAKSEFSLQSLVSQRQLDNGL